MFKSKGQVSIEVLIVLAILVVGGVVFGIYYINHLNTSIKESDQTGGLGTAVDSFVNSLDQNETITTTGRLSIQITSPTITTFTVGSAINFIATATEANGTVRCDWNYGTTRFQTNSCNFIYSSLPVGIHTITVRATDNRYTATDTKQITINPTVPSFNVQIINPGTTIYVGQSTVFSATAQGALPGDYNCSWKLDGANISNQCNFTHTPPSCVDNKLLRLESWRTTPIPAVFDSNSKTVNITSALSGQIRTLPETGTQYNFGEHITFTAVFSGSHGDVTCEWFIDGGAVKNYGNDECILYTEVLPVGFSDIKVVIDDACRTIEPTVAIDILRQDTFVARILTPIQGQTFFKEEPINLSIITNLSDPNTELNCYWEVNSIALESSECNINDIQTLYPILNTELPASFNISVMVTVVETDVRSIHQLDINVVEE